MSPLRGVCLGGGRATQQSGGVRPLVGTKGLFYVVMLLLHRLVSRAATLARKASTSSLFFFRYAFILSAWLFTVVFGTSAKSRSLEGFRLYKGKPFLLFPSSSFIRFSFTKL